MYYYWDTGILDKQTNTGIDGGGMYMYVQYKILSSGKEISRVLSGNNEIMSVGTYLMSRPGFSGETALMTKLKGEWSHL